MYQRLSLGIRFTSFLFLGLFLAVLVLPFWLTPNPLGYGTHIQLGLPACWFRHLFNLPCPTCGLTTSLTHLTAGHWQLALQANLLGPLVYLGAMAGAVISMIGVVHPEIFSSINRLHGFRFMIDVGLVLLVLAWGYTIVANQVPLP